MKKCICDGKGWIRMPGTKAIIYCPDCEKPKILKKKTLKLGTKVISPIFGTGELIESSKNKMINVKFSKLENDTSLERSEVSYIYDQD
jgi:hypothetical protein